MQEPTAAPPGQQTLPPDSGGETTAACLPLHQQQQQQQAASSWQYEKGCWEAFHARDNATARFYKERRLVCGTQPVLVRIRHARHSLCRHVLIDSCDCVFQGRNEPQDLFPAMQTYPFIGGEHRQCIIVKQTC